MKRMVLLIIPVMLIMIFPAKAHAGRHWDINGGYYRDDSNDGQIYNNANYQGLNSNRREVICNSLSGQCYS